MTTTSKSAPAVEGRGLTKRYGPTLALDNVDFTLAKGGVMALFGENGAGKSTLVRLISGSTTPDKGALFIDGTETHLHSPKQALDRGIALVAQELAGCPKLSAAENILIGNMPNRWGVTSQRQIAASAALALQEHGVDLPLHAKLETLKLADRQLVEILKGLTSGTSVLLLDEPTASLSASEANQLLDHVRRLASTGLSTVLITHRIDEALDFVDSVVVLRDGKVVHRSVAADTDRETIAYHMLGREQKASAIAATSVVRANTANAISIKDWKVGGKSPLKGVDIKVGMAEIVAVYGLRGSGIESLAEGLAGDLPRLRGLLAIGERCFPRPFRKPHARQRAGVSYLPSDRRDEGLGLRLSTRTNILSPANPASTRRYGIRRFPSEKQEVNRLVDDLGIVCSHIDQLVRELSGGNQQKVLLASRLLQGTPSLILHEPTRGVDIGARESIHARLRSLRQEDVGILLISSDIDEVETVADRVVVLRDGVVAAEFTGHSIVKASILLAASGRA